MLDASACCPNLYWEGYSKPFAGQILVFSRDSLPLATKGSQGHDQTHVSHPLLRPSPVIPAVISLVFHVKDVTSALVGFLFGIRGKNRVLSRHVVALPSPLVFFAVAAATLGVKRGRARGQRPSSQNY